MQRTWLSRLVAIALASGTALAVPLSALAHGYAHHHAAAEHHGVMALPGSGSSLGFIMTPMVAEASNESHGDHLHAIIGAAMTTKVSTVLVAPSPGHPPLPTVPTVSTVPPECDRRLEPRASRGQAPPPNLRAPPAVALIA